MEQVESLKEENAGYEAKVRLWTVLLWLSTDRHHRTLNTSHNPTLSGIRRLVTSPQISVCLTLCGVLSVLGDCTCSSKIPLLTSFERCPKTCVYVRACVCAHVVTTKYNSSLLPHCHLVLERSSVTNWEVWM